MAGGKSDRQRWTRSRLYDVEVEILALRGQLTTIRARSSGGRPSSPTSSESVEHLLDTAGEAARGGGPSFLRSLRPSNGACVEAAYLNVHRAEAEIAKMYDAAQVDAAIPEAVARLQSSLPAGDLRCTTVAELHSAPASQKALKLAIAIQIGHEAKDQQYAKIRRFRNITLEASTWISFFLVVFAVLVSVEPNLLPLCFPRAGQPDFCPAGRGSAPGSWDVWAVMLLGLLGGALSAAVSVRNIRGAPTPYNLATALAWLKVPSGALTAVGALILIKGAVVPGLSALDSQGQVLAYALVFGYAQQVLTRLIDQRAVELVQNIPSKDGDGPAGHDRHRPPHRSDSMSRHVRSRPRRGSLSDVQVLTAVRRGRSPSAPADGW